LIDAINATIDFSTSAFVTVVPDDLIVYCMVLTTFSAEEALEPTVT
jgi:hypothetical protein